MEKSSRTSEERNGGRHSYIDPAKKVRADTPVIREILQNTGQIAKPERKKRSRDLALPEASHHLEQRNGVISVLLADDHPIVREGLATVINGQSGMRVIAQASDGREAVEKFNELQPDILLIDLRMPVMDGIQAVSAICAQDASARVVILTTYQDEEDVYRVLQTGARGYILKTAPVAELVHCISDVAAGRTWVPPEVGATLARRVSAPELTRREQQVLQAMAAGKSNKEIGVALEISEGTVKVHMTHVLEKLKVSGRTEAIAVAVKRGLVRIDSPMAA